MKKTVAVIGEGITEKYYIESLKGLAAFDIKPNSLNRNASSIKKLEKSVKKSIQKGYDEVYCLIDMDGKSTGLASTNYLTLKGKYHNIVHRNKSKGISCKVIFIESERCTEIWFLFHFLKNSTTKKYTTYKQLEADLKKFRPDYEKSQKYFKSLKKGPFHDLASGNGNVDRAKENSKKSLESKMKDNRDYTYSEVHLLIEALNLKKVE